MGSDHFCLRWNNFQSNIVSALESLKTEEDLVDVTLACEGQSVKAHKVILSACSPYFRNVFKENPCQHPVVILKDVSYDDVAALLSFMYQGEVYITQDRLASFLHTAELLQIRGLTGATSPFRDGQQQQQQPIVKQQPHSSSRQPSPTPIAQSAPNANSSGQQSTTFSQLPASSSSTSYPPSSTSYSASSSVSSPKRKKAIPRRVSTSYSVPPQSTGEEKLISEPCEPNDQAGTKIVNLTTKQEPPDIDEEMEDEATLSNYEGSERDQGEERDETRLSSEEIDAPEHEGKSPPSHEDSTTSSMLAKSLTSFRPMDSQGIYSSSMPPTFGQPGSPELSSGGQSRQGWRCMQPRSCSFCWKTFSNTFNMKQHVINVHMPGEGLTCHLCCKVVKNKWYLRKHLVTAHNAPLKRIRTKDGRIVHLPDTVTSQNSCETNFMSGRASLM